MLSRLVNYIMGAPADSEENDNVQPLAVAEARLRQVEVEGDDWILIDRTVEGLTAMDESWYVTPPACFTRTGPIHMETSPLEDLLIEHPSMSVYRATAAPPIVPDTPPPTPDAPDVEQDEPERRVHEKPPKPVVAPSRRSRDANRIQPAPRRPSVRETRAAVRVDDNVHLTQIRSAQKILEKRSSKTSKRSRLERGNKVREVASGKGRRPRRQDRLRLRNSGANNNRKC